MTDSIILETRQLTKEFKGFVAVSKVDLKVKRGTIHALIGPNGAGKTTCFNLLTKFLTPTSGQILFEGADITAQSPAQIARHGVIRSFQNPRSFRTSPCWKTCAWHCSGRWAAASSSGAPSAR